MPNPMASVLILLLFPTSSQWQSYQLVTRLRQSHLGWASVSSDQFNMAKSQKANRKANRPADLEVLHFSHSAHMAGIVSVLVMEDLVV